MTKSVEGDNKVPQFPNDDSNLNTKKIHLREWRDLMEVLG